MRLRSALALVALTAVALHSGCTGKYKSDFSVVVVNRAVNTIEVLANAASIGQVAPGKSETFVVNLTESNPNQYTNGVAPTPQSLVTFTAKDVKTGMLSTTKSMTLSGGTPTYLTFEPSDFLVTTQTVARFTFSPASPGLTDDVAFTGATSTVSGAGTFRWDFGDGGTATGVTASHRFPREGTYNVALTVTSDNGQSSTASRSVIVSASLPSGAANYSFSPAAPAVNQDVYFNAATSGVSGGTFAWDFGDGTTGSGISVTHRFGRAGSYTVTLRVTNSAGQSAVSSKTVTASNTSPSVVANFVLSPTSPSINQTVYFNASASTPSTGNFRWDFGDGESGTGITPTHSYDYGGTYSVTLTVTNDVGQSASVTRSVTVQATSSGVTASFVYSPTTPAVNQEIFFDAAASRPADGNFAWDFGDGAAPGSGVMPSHRYAVAATYTVTLTVTNSLGQSATTSRTVTVQATSAQVSASFVFSPTSPAINQDIFFDAAASRPADGTFTWDFGDGTARGSGVTPTHRYTVAATYTVTLTVANALGQTATTSRTVTVQATSSQVTSSFIYSPVNPGINQDVYFNASASRPTDGTFAWNFGDGTAAGSGVAPTHRYGQAGTYTVVLTVANSLGQTATSTRTVTVTASSTNVTASFTFSPTAAAVNQVVYFDASASRPVTATFSWNFGDGTPAGSGLTPTHQYTGPGTYTVTLNVRNSEGQTATATRTVAVTNTSSAVTASFTYSPTSPTTEQLVYFNASASTPSTATFNWNFGDGTTGTGVTPTHLFPVGATYRVTLTVTNSSGQTATSSSTVTVTPVTLAADFTFSPTNPSMSGGSNTVYFDATPSSPSATTWTWDFGDGSAAETGQRATHTFTKAGSWVVRLTIGDAGGRTATITRTVTVTS